jgi:hypothetical protein
VLVGEDLLMQEFVENPEAGKNQVEIINSLIEKENRQKANNNRNHSAIGSSMHPS